MAASNPAQYAKLGKEEEQGDAKNIRPGELNLPVRVPELELRRSVMCWQVLPPDYQPPLDEAWTTGCAEDSESCWTGLLCPCVLFGRNAEALRGVPWMRACTCHAICVEGGIALAILTAVFHGVITPHWISFLIGEGLANGWILCSGVLPFIFFVLVHLFRTNIISRTLHKIHGPFIAVYTVARTVRSIVKGKLAFPFGMLLQ